VDIGSDSASREGVGMGMTVSPLRKDAWGRTGGRASLIVN